MQTNRVVNQAAIQRRIEKRRKREAELKRDAVDYRIKDELNRAGVDTARFAEIFG